MKVLLVDGYSLLFRGFHALPLLTAPDGTYTNAIHGFFSMLIKALGEYRPDSLAVMLDVHAPTFRHTLFPDYKGTRKPMPEELRPQTELLRRLLSAMHISTFEMEGYEADDLLGTASRLAEDTEWEALILTGDRDSLQLAGNGTKIILTRKGITESQLLDAEGVLSNYGFTPAQVPDMKGLMGDSSDNIPGIPGIGEKTALKLMNQYGNLDNILAHSSEIKGKLGEKISAGKDSAILSRQLGTICRTAPLDICFENCSWNRMLDAEPLLLQYSLHTLLKSIRELISVSPSYGIRSTDASKRASGGATIFASAMETENESKLPKIRKPLTILTFHQTDELIKAIASCPKESQLEIALYEGEGEISVFFADGTLWSIPLGGDLLTPGLFEEDVYACLAPLLESSSLTVHNGKALMHRLNRLGLNQPAISFDTMLAAYLLHTAQKDYGIHQSLAVEYGQIPKHTNASIIASLAERQKQRLNSRGMNVLLSEIELPLSHVLYCMEKEGFRIDRQVLKELGKWFSTEVDECRKAVYRETGVDSFNLNSPKQLGEVLFEKLGLPFPQKKGKTGYSTSAEILENLVHPCIEPLLRYRRMSKLQSTYVEGLQKLIQADDRVHTNFDQTATVTGRISSQEPNLQNIPIRTEEGREIRRAFVSQKGKILLDADYSQIELRILAHMSEDAAMCDAFLQGQDIHTRTASEINGVSMDAVTAEMRRAAKAINFGIVYGISAFGLARNAGISRANAKHFIEMYFRRYPGVKQFMDECIRKGNELGYAETLFGRRRELFELRNPNRNLRSFGERAAMNTPVQGTAADIIKMAMVQVQNRLEEGGFSAKLILQVHDELVIECPEAEADTITILLKQTMENVCRLRVPLVAEVSRGINWDEAH